MLVKQNNANTWYVNKYYDVQEVKLDQIGENSNQLSYIF